MVTVVVVVLALLALAVLLALWLYWMCALSGDISRREEQNFYEWNKR